MVSSLGSQASGLAFPLLVLSVTHSAAQTGLVAAVRGLSTLLLPLPVGVLVDRWDRKRLMILSELGRSIALGSIPLALVTGHLSLLLLATVSLVEGALQNVFGLAGSATLLRVVSDEELGDAVAFGSVGESVSRLLGPSIAGLLFTVDRALPFLADAVSYVASALSLVLIQPDFQGQREAPSQKFWAEIAEAMRWLWCQSVLRFLAFLVTGLNLFSFGYQLILIVRAQDLGANAFEIGLLFAVGGAVGSLGTLVGSYLQRRLSFRRLVVIATWGWTLTWVPYALAPNFATLFVGYLVGAPVVGMFILVQSTYQLQVVPDELRGRVNSVFRLITVGVEPLSVALTGILLQAYGGVSTVLIVFAPQVVLAALTTVFNRQLRGAASTRSDD